MWVLKVYLTELAASSKVLQMKDLRVHFISL